MTVFSAIALLALLGAWGAWCFAVAWYEILEGDDE
jgi:hypothetical protein